MTEISKAELGDLGAIVELQHTAYQSEARIYNDFTIQPLTQTLDGVIAEYHRGVILKAESNGKIIGSVRAYADGDTVYIGKLMVHPEHQGKGLGKRLLSSIENALHRERFELFTGAKSERNLHLYETAGYTRFREESGSMGIVEVYLEKRYSGCNAAIKTISVSIRIVTENKKDFLPLLLEGDEQESSVDQYLERGELFALYAGDLKSICLVTDEGGGTLEIQNLATDARYRRQGYASVLISYITGHYESRYERVILGTGDVPGILSFYEKCGFSITHRVVDYFTTQYDHPIMEEGVLLKDKVYLERKLKSVDI